MNAVGELLMKRKRAMTIDQIAEAAHVSRSHAKNSVTSYREKSQWIPLGHYIEWTPSKRGSKYRLARY